MKRRVPILLAACVLATGCAARSGIHAAKPLPGKSARARRQMLFGWWVEREPVRSGGTRVELALQCPDGVYFFDFRTLDRAGKLIDEQQEVGDWGISGPVFFTITRAIARGNNRYEVDPTKGYYYDAYRILELSYTRFRYREYGDGDVFSAHRAMPNELSELRGQTGVMRLPSGCKETASGDAGASAGRARPGGRHSR